VAAATPAAAFKRSVTTDESGLPTDVCLYWPQRTVTWRAASPLGAAAGEEPALAALRSSFRSWNAVGCSDLTIQEGERTDRSVGYRQRGSNTNVVLFRTEGSCERYRGEPCFEDETCPDEFDCWDYPADLLAVTTTTFDPCGQLLDADIEFNGGDFAFTAVDGPPCDGSSMSGCVAFDIANTATHEIGHLLGLDHPSARGNDAIKEATMYASAGSGETKKRSLEADDQDGLCSIYPTGAPADACVPAAECRSSTRDGGSGICSSAGGGDAGLVAAAAMLLLAGLRRRR
jgi:MYXO-CTERM domain-containing protein